MTAADRQLLLADGVASVRVAEERERIRALVAELVVPLVAEAERTRTFPREVVAELGRRGLYRTRWSGGEHGDAGWGVLLSEELGRAGTGGVGVGIALHGDGVLAPLLRFGTTPLLRDLAEQGLDGRQLGCIATSEDEAGSDLRQTATTAVPDGDGWRVRGHKRYVSLGAAADFALVLCRRGGTGGVHGRDGALPAASLPPLMLVVIPREGFEVERRIASVGMRSLETVRLAIDARVPADAVVGRLGAGLLVASWGLTHERLAASAQLVGGARLALALALEHLQTRRQFGQPLLERQALRLRLADMSARVRLARLGVYAAAQGSDAFDTRAVAGIKVTVARLAESVVTECAHLLGGVGYVEDATPIARLWRDARLGRLGGGTDEMLWELVASGFDAEGAG